MEIKNRHNEEKDEESWEIGDSEEDYDSDDSIKDPSFSTLEDTDSKFSKLLIKSKPKARVVKDNEADFDGQEVVLPELDEKGAKSFEMVQKIIEAGQIEKLKVEQCKLYLRKNGLRLTGNKDTLIRRIKEHLEVLNGGGEKKNPVSSFVLDCKGDACTGDVVMFEQNIYEMFDIASRSGKGPPCGTRIVAGRIVKESYGAAKQQHTFTIEVLWSKGEKPLPSLHPLLIKGRNLYRFKTLRQRWEDEGDRQKVLMEKHSRGSLARSDREARVQLKGMRKMLRTNRVSRKEEPRKNQSQLKSSLVLKSSAQPQQSGSLVNPQNLHQTGIAVTSGNMKMGSQQLGLLTDSAPQPPAPNPGFLVDNGNTTTQPQQRTHTTMTGKYFNQASQYWDESRISENTKRVYHHIGGAQNLKVNRYHSISNVPSLKEIPLNSQRQPLTSVNMSPREQKQMCRYYAQGRCYYGENCKFSHEMRENYNERRVERLPHSHQQMELGHYGNSRKVCHAMREKYGGRMEESWPHHVQRRF